MAGGGASAALATLAAASGAPAVVRRVCEGVGSKLEISVALGSRPLRTLSRPAGEPLRRSLQRLAGAKGALNDTELSELAQLVREDGTRIDHDVLVEHAWASAAELRLGGEAVPVLFDPPEVATLASPAAPLCGIPSTPFFTTRQCKLSEVVLTWWLVDPERCDVASSGIGAAGALSCSNADPSARGWRKVGHGVSFTPGIKDVGATLHVVATAPALPNRDPLNHSLNIGKIAQPPPRPVLEARLKTLEESAGTLRSSDRLRVMSYNMLADAYRRTWDEPGGPHSYCDRSLTVGATRIPRLLSEILSASPDIACLQEVDVNWVKTFWAPQLSAAGYDLHFTPKGSASSSEGIAVVVRSANFELVRERVAALNLRQPHPQVAPYVAANPNTAASIGALPTVAQIVVLRSRSDVSRLLVVANTHLFFANPAVHVRLLQMKALLAEVEMELEAYRKHDGGDATCFSIGVIIAGDFNADSTDSALKLLLDRYVSKSHPDWRIGALHWAPSLGLEADAAAAASRLFERLRQDGSMGADMQPTHRRCPPWLAEDPLAGITLAASSFSGEDATHHLRTVALAFHRLRRALKLLAQRQPRDRGGGSPVQVAARPAIVTLGSEELTGSELAAAAMEAVRKGETLMTSEALAAFEVSLYTKLPPRLPLSDEDISLAMSHLKALDEVLRANGVGTPTPGTACQASEDHFSPCGVDLSHSIELHSVYGVHTQPTHVYGEYSNALDWIAYSPSTIELRSTAALPSLDELKRDTGLPSAEFPSDHVSLIADLEWTGEAISGRNGDG